MRAAELDQTRALNSTVEKLSSDAVTHKPLHVHSPRFDRWRRRQGQGGTAMWDTFINGIEMPGGTRIAAERVVYADGDMTHLTVDPTKFRDLDDFCRTFAHVLLALTEAA